MRRIMRTTTVVGEEDKKHLMELKNSAAVEKMVLQYRGRFKASLRKRMAETRPIKRRRSSRILHEICTNLLLFLAKMSTNRNAIFWLAKVERCCV